MGCGVKKPFASRKVAELEGEMGEGALCQGDGGWGDGGQGPGRCGHGNTRCDREERKGGPGAVCGTGVLQELQHTGSWYRGDNSAL